MLAYIPAPWILWDMLMVHTFEVTKNHFVRGETLVNVFSSRKVSYTLTMA